MRRALLKMSVVLAAALAPASVAQATVVNVGGVRAGVAPVPGERGGPGTSTMAGPSDLFAPLSVTASGACNDPWLALDLRQPGGSNLPPDALCYQGGQVLHANEPFAITWDAPFNQQVRHYWETTRGFVQQFLRDVADSSGKLGSPYDLTPQYKDASGHAGHDARYGGGCIDYGHTGGSTCRFPDQSTASSTGADYPTGPACTPSGYSYAPDALANGVCLTDSQIQTELKAMYGQMGLKNRTQPGYTPLLVMLTPPQVEVCLNATNTLCSANSSTAPPTPSLTSQPTGGTAPAGTYKVELTYVLGSGETEPSASQTITTTTNTSTIMIESPPGLSGAVGWYAYVTQAGGGVYTRQQAAGSPTPIGTNLQLTTTPSSSGSEPPSVSTPTFCSYHSYVTLGGGTRLPYVVQPWTAFGRCDEPDVPALSPQMTTVQVEQNAGQRLVSPLSQGQIAAITNPFLNGWWASDGSETNDNSAYRMVDPFSSHSIKVGRCIPIGNQLDKVTVGSSAQNPYFLQREFNNAGAIQADLNSPQCAPWVNLNPGFVVPSPINAGDIVAFDGSVTDSTLMVPRDNYHWKFGDGSTGTGPSVVHTFGKAGYYNVTLTVTDRGGNTATVSKSVEVLDHNGHPPGGGGGHAFRVRVQLMPQGLSSVLRHGLEVKVRSNQRADGFATLSISSSAARRAHLHAARSGSVVIARGTVSGIKSGTRTLHLRLSRASASRLRRLRHVTINLRLTLVGAHGSRVTVDAAGSY